MRALRGALLGRPAHEPSQQQTNHIQQMDSSTPKPSSAGRRLVGWAMSALRIRNSSPVVQTAAALAPAPAFAGSSSGRLRLAIVGDVHGAWRGEREEAALRLLAPDLTLLVGDFGNEDVRLVRQVAALGLPKAVILGNHDAWYTMTGRSAGGARRGAVQQTASAADLLADMKAGGGGGAEAASGGPAAAVPEQDGVRQQLAALGSCHVGYGSMRLDEQGYTVMGARPFSKGGKNFSTIRTFMEGLYGVTSMDESSERIVQVAESAPAHHALIVMGHNGPAGLGSRAFDICGVDWEAKAGDHGDPDLQAALAALHTTTRRRVALVTFGHMHHTLHSSQSGGRPSRLRRMVALDPTTGTVYLNAATVPRVIPAPTTTTTTTVSAAAAAASGSTPLSLKSFGSGRRARMAAKAAAAAAAAASATVVAAPLPNGGVYGGVYGGGPATQHHFMLAELEYGEVVSARDVWVQVTPVTDGTAATVLGAATSVAAAAAAAAAPGSSGGGGGGGGADSDAGGGTRERRAEEVEAAVAAGPRQIGGFVVQVVREHVVLRTVAGADGDVVKFVWNAYDQLYEPYVFEVRSGLQRARKGSDDGHGRGGDEADGEAAADGSEQQSGEAAVAVAGARKAVVVSGVGR